MKKIFNNLKIALLFASVIASQLPDKEKFILSDDLEKDIKKLKEPFFVVVRGRDKPEYEDVTKIKHKFDDGLESVNVFSQAYVNKIAGDKATFFVDGAYGFALINPKVKVEKVKETEKPPETDPKKNGTKEIKPGL